MPSVALVLGAGGVVGHAWHAGVLQALAGELGWDGRAADLVVGTSAGSVVGAILRAGIGPDDLYARATDGTVSADARRALAEAGMSGPLRLPPRPVRTVAGMLPASLGLVARTAAAPWRVRPGLLAAGLLPRGLVPTTGIGAGIEGLHRQGWPVAPLWLCAVRLDDGHRAVFGRSAHPRTTVGAAVEASCAIPGFFAPVTIDGREYIDGGAHSPTNADVVAGCGFDLVLVSSPMSIDRSAMRRPALDRVLRLTHRATLQREVTVVRDGHTSVVTLQPGPDDLPVMGGTAQAMDPRRRAAVARRARETTMRRLASPRLQAALGALPRPTGPAR